MSFWKDIDVKGIIDQIPDYKEFLTVEELDASSRDLVEKYENVEYYEIGKSREGRAINCLKIGEGEKNILFFAFPHPNEPIGSLTVEFTARYLAENPEFTKNTGYTWYLIKAMDVDGAKLNEGWFKGDFDPIKHAKNYYRPPFHEQIEWSFPIDYKKLKFDTPTPATQALMKIMEEIKPFFLYSLHNAGFCGVYFYVSRDIKPMCEEFQELVKNDDLPLHEGEPEMEFGQKLYSGIYKQLRVREGYDFYEEQGVNIADFFKIGAGSFDYLQEVAGKDNFCLICEMPYIYDKNLENTNPSEHSRRDLVLGSIKARKEIFSYMRKIFKNVEPYCDKSSRLFSTVATNMKTYKQQLNVSAGFAKSSPQYERKATIAEAFDSQFASQFYALNTFSQLGRLCGETHEQHPDKAETKQMQKDVEDYVEQRITSLMSEINLEIIPIRKLVRIQVGSAFIALKHLSK